MFLRQYSKYEHLMATSWSFSIKYLSLIFIDFKKFLNVFIFLVTKPREVTSRNINWKFDDSNNNNNNNNNNNKIIITII